MKQLFYHLLAVLVVIITYALYGSIILGICSAFEKLGWNTTNYASFITGILFGYSIQWLEKKNKELDK